jgi:superfamily II DNA helicase RecQ
MFDNASFHHLLEAWQETDRIGISTMRGADGLLERIRQALLALKPNRSGSLHIELCALFRQLQLRHAPAGVPSWLRVPRSDEWPDSAAWRQAGFDVVERAEALDVRATRPRMSWLGQQADLFDDAFALIPARERRTIPMDPFVAAITGLDSFTGEGQREAVRALLQSPEDVALIANLPTGSGKSILAQIPPLLHGEGFLSLVILPTVALALDQEERMNALFRRQSSVWRNPPLAFHGGLELDKRTEIFRALSEGRQRVLFTSPESATGSLQDPLIRSASAGRLTHVIVDEAHLVASWGSGFRPAFQLLPALVHRLRSQSPVHRPVRVVLASATLTEHTVRVLQHQFGPPEKTALISAVHLRPEPRYASVRCDSEKDRRTRVIEVLRFAPRPFILYVTKPEEAQVWLRELRDIGFSRVDQFTGQTPANTRKQLLAAWNSNQLDGMVATSAFGLGVDKDDVRTVVHATLPESLDRFYQEVGRAGRDGKACSSLLLFTDEDMAAAKDMSGHVFIGNELGYQRWTAMRSTAQPVLGPLQEQYVSLDALRPHLRVRGVSNRQWNLRTLNLMATAGMIELTGLFDSPPGQGIPELDESEIDGAHELRFASIRIKNPRHSIQAVFEQEMNEARQEYAQSSELGFRLLMSIALRSCSVERALSELYRLGGSHWAPVEPLCGGCSADWSSRPKGPLLVQPLATRPMRFQMLRSDPWPSAFPTAGPGLGFVVVDDVHQSLMDRHLLNNLLAMARPHCVMLPSDAGLQQVEAVRQSVERCKYPLFFDRPDPCNPLSLEGGEGEVRVLIWPQHEMAGEVFRALWTVRSAFTIVVLARSVPDPARADRRISDVEKWIDEDTLERELTT